MSNPDHTAGPDTSPLDNPIWNALRTEHRSFALGSELAMRYPAEIGPLSGMPDQSLAAWQALRSLAGAGGTLGLFCQQPTPAPPGWTLVRGGLLVQMICLSPKLETSALLSGESAGLRQLTLDDVPSMLELTALTNPGPFQPRTIELGAFFGIFSEGRLLAMAGQRLHLPDFVEVSAVCTHPDARGLGYARTLMSKVIEEILNRGKTPILHSFADNTNAIRVYRDLGFTLHRNLHLAVLRNEA